MLDNPNVDTNLEAEVTETHEEVVEPSRAAKRINQLVGKLKQKDSDIAKLSELKKINDVLVAHPELDQQVRTIVSPYLNPKAIVTQPNTQSALEQEIRTLKERLDSEDKKKALKEAEDTLSEQLGGYQEKEKLSDDEIEMLASIVDSKGLANEKGEVDFAKARPILDKWLKKDSKPEDIVVIGGGSRPATPPADGTKKMTEAEIRAEFIKQHPNL